MANIRRRRRRHIAGGSTHSFTLSTKNSASLSALMSVDATQAFVAHVTRLMKITAGARGHTIFDLNGPLL